MKRKIIMEQNIINQLPKENQPPIYEIDSLKQVMKEGGIPFWSRFIEELSILHTIERGYLPSGRDELIKILKENTQWETSKIVDLVNRVKRFESHFPSYNLMMNEKLTKVQNSYNQILPFQWIGEGSNCKMIGIVNEGGKKTIYEHSGNHPMVIGYIEDDYSIQWNNYVVLTTPQQKYIVDEVKKMKGRIV
jgi:hypothetical protein